MQIKRIFFLTTALAGLLVLTACGGGAADNPLSGTSWVLDSISSAEIPAGVEVTLSFEEERLSGRACNNYGGDYSVNDESFETGEIESTLMACMEPEGIMDLETAYLRAMWDAQSFTMNEGQLQITAAGGQVLTFRAAQ